MCFDVPNVVRSPGCDHGHDEESRNGRDIKIDILDDYIRTSERFRVIRVFSGVPGSYGNSYWASLGHTGKERKGQKSGRTPPLGLVRIGLGRGGASFLPSPSPFPSSTPTRKGGILLPVGVGLPPWARLLPLAGPLLLPFIYGGGGHPIDTTIDILIS